MAEVHLASRRTSTLLIISLFLLFNLCYDWTFLRAAPDMRQIVKVPLHAQELVAKCRSLQLKPGPPVDFYNRTVSDRFQPGTKPVLIKNARIWTGRVQGLEIIKGDLLLDGGIIKAVGHVGRGLLDHLKDITIVDAQRAWVTPGIVDLHSHVGVMSLPELQGSSDSNSFHGPILPWLRSVDGLNTHDESYASAIAGGVTTALILPGSANAIGGQAFTIKLRPTKERSPTSMLLESPFSLTPSDEPGYLRWRHMKHACGENPSRTYSITRMDTSWALRQAYNTARNIKQAQDDFCVDVLDGNWAAVAHKEFPESLQWEALVDTLRGRVKVQTHCYEAVDIDDFVRLSNEFEFPVAAFHHAHEAWLVPDVLKRAYERPPAAAMFATFSRYKREAYRHSEFAPRILADNDIDVVMKSDHPGIISRYLIHEAAQAHYWGLDDNIALASVTTTPAKVLGLDYRVGYIKEGYDADITIWDSHPLALGATPIQVFIDGLAQLTDPAIMKKPSSVQSAPKTPDFEEEIKAAIKYEGLPPLTPIRSQDRLIVFTNVSNVYTRSHDGSVVESFRALDAIEAGVAVVHDGQLVCHGPVSRCEAHILAEAREVSLEGGSLQPGLAAAATTLGMQEIAMETSTTDGIVYNPLEGDLPSILGEGVFIPRAIDGLMLGARDSLLAYRAGVTLGISAPVHGSFLGGASTAFFTGSRNRLESGAIFQSVAAVHVSLAHGDLPSVSTEIAALMRLLLSEVTSSASDEHRALVEGKLPLAVEVHSADIIATLIDLKSEVEDKLGYKIKMTIVGGAEAHLLASELAQANIGVILFPPRPIPYTWDLVRMLHGPPLTNTSAVSTLVNAGVTIGFGPQGVNAMPYMSAWATRNLRFDAGWALSENANVISRADALAMVSTNVEKLLGVKITPYESDLVVTSGGDLLSFEGKVVAVISPRRSKVDFFE